MPDLVLDWVMLPKRQLQEVQLWAALVTPPAPSGTQQAESQVGL